MSRLDLKEEKEILKFITGMLKRRGLSLYGKDDWEIHGPHKGMNYQVYVGYAQNIITKECGCIVIYPKAIYWIEDPCDWWKCEPENRILLSQ
jgi:hypothetical protein